MISWPSKDPDEVLDYTVNWANECLESGETISTSTFTVAEGSVTIDSESNTDGVANVWLSGGELGERCVILNRITTSEGRTYDQSVTLRIRAH